MDHWTILLDLYIIYKIVEHVIVGRRMRIERRELQKVRYLWIFLCNVIFVMIIINFYK